MNNQNPNPSFLNQIKKDASSLFSSAKKLVGISNSNENNYRVLKERNPEKKEIIEKNNSRNTTIENVLESLKQQNGLKITAQKYSPVVINKLIKDLIVSIKNEVKNVKPNIISTNSIRLNNLTSLKNKPNLSTLIDQAEKILQIQKYQIESLKSIVKNNSNKPSNGKHINNSLARTSSTGSLF
jgi:hypothetical protein